MAVAEHDVGQRLDAERILLRSVAEADCAGCYVYAWDAERVVAGSHDRGSPFPLTYRIPF